MEPCTFCENTPAVVNCVWIRADRTPCESRMCEECKAKTLLNICQIHPHPSWVAHETHDHGNS